MERGGFASLRTSPNPVPSWWSCGVSHFPSVDCAPLCPWVALEIWSFWGFGTAGRDTSSASDCIIEKLTRVFIVRRHLVEATSTGCSSYAAFDNLQSWAAAVRLSGGCVPFFGTSVKTQT